MSKKDDDSTSQAVSERHQGGALVAVSGNLVRERPQKTALDEEKFTGVCLVSIYPVFSFICYAARRRKTVW